MVEVIEARLQELGGSITRASAPGQVEPRAGALGDKELRTRVSSLTRAESLLGIYILETQRKKRRQRVVDALRERATELALPTLHADMNVVDIGGHEFSYVPDLAAGVLASSDDQIDTKTIEYFVPNCRDAVVLGWLGDDDLVKARLAQLEPTLPGATVH